MMTKEAARRVSDLMVKMGVELDQSLQEVRRTETEDEFRRYREAVSKMMMIMLIDVMNPIHEQYPDLKPPELE